MNGSSPLTRGKLDDNVRHGEKSRLIPAHAGKTSTPLSTPLSTPAHPRSRGENRLKNGSALSVLGSSPLTRGKRTNGALVSDVLRLIPAHAGKTALDRCKGIVHRAHPRSRGENRASIGAGDLRAGSSPLTRGKHSLRVLDPTQCRLIPAHAGKTPFNHLMGL